MKTLNTILIWLILSVPFIIGGVFLITAYNYQFNNIKPSTPDVYLLVFMCFNYLFAKEIAKTLK